jgi:ATP-binding protein involved in chromosome partitioning
LRVGLLDIDIHGPSVPTLLNLEKSQISSNGNSMNPITMSSGMKVMSVGFFLNRQETAIIWRGPRKQSIIKQFIKDVEWGELDYLIIDCPPGTGDEPLSIAQLLNEPTGVLIVTTPQTVAIADVKKSVDFCNQIKLPILGVIENMSGFICPCCNEKTDIFTSGGGKKMADDMKIPFLGSIPLDPAVVTAAESGIPYVERYKTSALVDSFNKIVQPVFDLSLREVAPEN